MRYHVNSHLRKSEPQRNKVRGLLVSFRKGASDRERKIKSSLVTMDYSSATLLYFFFLLVNSLATHETDPKGIDLLHPALDITSHPLSVNSKDILLCDRVQVVGISRLKLGNYASSLRVSVVPSVVIPERLHGKIQICFHRNNSLELCQCEKDQWKTIQKGSWSFVMSPYEDRYVDVKFIDGVTGPVTVSLDEDFQQWRLVCLATGFALLLLAPIVSSWVPFYYSSSMAIGVFLVIIILLFQGMKLLPTGRKNIFYLTVYGSMLGAGSYLLNHFSMMINSLLLHFGMSEEMHNPVSIFVLVGVILSGAALGYWIVRKFVISKDGSVDVGVAQFVKWSMRIIATTSIFQSTLDTPLAVAALVCCWAVSYVITSLKWLRAKNELYEPRNVNDWQRQGKQTVGKRSRAEFLSKSSPQGGGVILRSPNSRSAWSNSPVKGVRSPSYGMKTEKEYYSSFHKTTNRKRFTKEEWDNFTRDSTQQALAEWASSPEFTDWIIEHADRIQLLPSESSEDVMGSESDSTDENVVQSGNRFKLFNW